MHHRLMDRLLSFELDRSNPPDARRIIRDERQALHVARDRWSHLSRSRARVPEGSQRATQAEVDAAREHLDAVASEAERVLTMHLEQS